VASSSVVACPAGEHSSRTRLVCVNVSADGSILARMRQEESAPAIY